MVKEIGHLVDGVRVFNTRTRLSPVFNPNTGEVQGQVALASREDVEHAVSSAQRAQPAWGAKTPQARGRVFAEFVRLLHREKNALAELLSLEHGKTIADSLGDIQRGLEVCEFVTGIAHLLKGEYTQGAGPGIDMYSMRQPLGVVAGISPFNFPAMVPMWKFAPAIACGNAFILKPSERVPSVPLRLGELMLEAGLPPGILNVVNGDKEAVDALLEDPRVCAIGFVGSTPVAEYIYAKGSAHGKRVHCFGGAKNHMLILPDADIDAAANALIGAGYGSAGERCMAISVAVPVGEKTANTLMECLIPKVRGLKMGVSTDPEADFGPLITQEAKGRVLGYIAKGLEQGATLAVDGRDQGIAGYEHGFFLGGCLFDHVTREMTIYQEEIFGPVLSVVRSSTYEEALRLPLEHVYGNGVSIFTRSGSLARDFADRINIGMVGINVPIPVPLSYYSFGGWKKSMFGDLNQHGTDSIRFYTRTKTVTARWLLDKQEEEGGGAHFVIPTLS